MKMAAKNLLHDFRLPPAQQTIIDKDARQLFANGLMQKRRRHARIDSAAQTEDDSFLARPLANLLDGLVEVMAHGPFAAAPANACGRNWQ